jgi:hypothetical protein
MSTPGQGRTSDGRVAVARGCRGTGTSGEWHAAVPLPPSVFERRFVVVTIGSRIAGVVT